MSTECVSKSREVPPVFIELDEILDNPEKLLLLVSYLEHIEHPETPAKIKRLFEHTREELEQREAIVEPEYPEEGVPA